jgi:hypothetical protein
MEAKRPVTALWRSHPAVSIALLPCDARLPLPKMPEWAILRPAATGNPGNVGSNIA